MAKNNKDPWFGESYGDEPDTPNGYNDFFASYDPEEYATRRRNQQMVRAGEGYYNSQYNGRGGIEKVQNPPRVTGRRWGLLLEKYGNS